MSQNNIGNSLQPDGLTSGPTPQDNSSPVQHSNEKLSEIRHISHSSNISLSENKKEVRTTTDTVPDNDQNVDPNYLLTLKYSKEEENKLVRKYDLHLLTFLCAIYMVSYLDRSNIGNANTAGLSKDIGMSDKQYQWVLTIFYIAYICFQWTTALWKMFRPSRYVYLVVIGWGITSTLQAVVSKWSHVMVIRFLLGIFEAGFGPGVPYYLSFFYYRHEIALRTGIFMVVPPISSAFSGALAYGITKNKTSIAPWKILFIVEGIPTVLLGVLCFWMIPDDSRSMRVLSEREKEIAAARTLRQIGTIERDHKIDWREGLRSLFDIKIICCMFMYFAINVSFASLPVYLPTIIKSMGYSSVNAQGLTAPPYILAAICTLAATYTSDKIKQRGIFVTLGFTISAAGYLILANISEHQTAVRYFAVYLCCAGVFPCVAVLLSWVGNMQGGDGKKNFGYIFLQAVGQCGPLLGTRIYPASDGPRFRKGFWINFGFLSASAVVSIFLRTYLTHLNKKLDEKYGKPEFTAEQLIEMQTRPMQEGEEYMNRMDNSDKSVMETVAIESEANKNFRYIY